MKVTVGQFQVQCSMTGASSISETRSHVQVLQPRTLAALSTRHSTPAESSDTSSPGHISLQPCERSQGPTAQMSLVKLQNCEILTIKFSFKPLSFGAFCYGATDSKNTKLIYLPRKSSELQPESKRVQSKTSVNGG